MDAASVARAGRKNIQPPTVVGELSKVCELPGAFIVEVCEYLEALSRWDVLTMNIKTKRGMRVTGAFNDELRESLGAVNVWNVPTMKTTGFLHAASYQGR